MTPEARQIASDKITALCCERRVIDGVVVYRLRGTNDIWDATPPDWFNDLNAMHEAEKYLTDAQYDSFRTMLRGAMNDDPKPVSPSAKDVGPETTTLRDYFAAAALTGFYANPNGTYSYRWRHTDGSVMLLGPGQTPLTKGHGEWYVEATPKQVMARDMYSAADAMLAERKKGA
jgi:hypothetical protein